MRLLPIAGLLLALCAAPAFAHDLSPEQLRGVGFEQHIGDRLPLDLAFRDENDRPVSLHDYFGTRPVILSLNYLHCANLCPLELQGLVSGLNGVPFTLGEQYTLLTVSFDAHETPAQAQTARSRALRGYVHPERADGWHVLTTGDQATIDAVTQAIGFKYVYDPQEDDYAHPTGVTVVSPAGDISRYLYGLDFSATDLRLALVDAAAQRLGSLADRALLVCYHYDPIAGRYTPLVLGLLRAGGGAALLVVCAGDVLFVAHGATRMSGLLAPPQASSVAAEVDALMLVLLAVSALLTLAIFAAIVTFCIRYRRRPGNEVSQRARRTAPLEIAWTLIPAGLAMIPFVWGAQLYLHEALPPPDAMEVYVVARQWMWKAQQPDGQSEIDALHVPQGRAVKLTMISQDVIHSFSVPAFRLKADVLPGRFTTLWFQATQPGDFPLYCSEYCGTDHARMLGTVTVMRPADYAAWLTGGATASNSPAAQGRALFRQYACVDCHETGRAPNLAGVFGQPVLLSGGSTVTADEDYIRQSILSPDAKVVAGYQPIMPSFAGRLTDDELIALIAYVKSIGP